MKKNIVIVHKETGAILAKSGWFHCFCDDTKTYTTIPRAINAFKKRFPLSKNLEKVVFLNMAILAKDKPFYSMDDIYEAIRK